MVISPVVPSPERVIWEGVAGAVEDGDPSCSLCIFSVKYISAMSPSSSSSCSISSLTCDGMFGMI